MFQNLPDWVYQLQNELVISSLKIESHEIILNSICERFINNGIKIDRLTFGGLIIHPRYSAYSYTWYSDRDKIEFFSPSRTDFLSEGFRNSPFFYMATNNISFLRAEFSKEKDNKVEHNFPIFQNLRKQNFTDYIGFNYVLGENTIVSKPIFSREEFFNEVMCGAFSTKGENGFSDNDVLIFKSLIPYITLALRAKDMADLTTNIATAYIGQRSGKRVLSGEIDRGSVDTIKAIIWFGDLREFTQLSSIIPPQEMIDGLNDYLEIVSESLIFQGGEILKYMGDGVLGIIEIKDDAENAALRCLKAAEETFKKLEFLTKKRIEENKFTFDFDLALHTGIVSYGNIGSINRLDFTVIGPPVNEAARMESLCCSKNSIVLSKDFVNLLSKKDERIKSIGKHSFKGISEPKELFSFKV